MVYGLRTTHFVGLVMVQICTIEKGRYEWRSKMRPDLDGSLALRRGE